MAKERKVQAVREILDNLRSAEVLYLVDYRGLSVGEATDLRNRLRAVGASFQVVKNTLAKLAATEAGVEGLQRLFSGPTAITYCRADPVAPARVLQGFIREKRKFSIKGGYLQQRVLEPAEVDKMATLPSREELVARVIGGMAAPLFGFANVLQAPVRGLALVLGQIMEQKAKAEAKSA